MWLEFLFDTSSSNIVFYVLSDAVLCECRPACFVSAAPFTLVRLFDLCTLCHRFYAACHALSVRQQLLNPSSLAERERESLRCKKTRYMQLLFPPAAFFPPLLYSFYSPFCFSTHSLCVFPHLPWTTAAPPPLPSNALSLIFLICLQPTPHTHLSFSSLLFLLSLNLQTPFLFNLSIILLHFLFSLCLQSTLWPPPICYDSSTFPWQNQGRESNHQLLYFHLVSGLELWKEALYPRPFIASGGMSCVIQTEKDFGLTGIFGAHGKIWAS